MRFCVVAEETNYDMYDLQYDPEYGVEVVEADSEDNAIAMSRFADLYGLQIFAYQVSPTAKLGEHTERPDPLPSDD